MNFVFQVLRWMGGVSYFFLVINSWLTSIFGMILFFDYHSGVCKALCVIILISIYWFSSIVIDY
jgi:hypothetical protein